MMVYLHVPGMFPIKNRHFSQGIPHVQNRKRQRVKKELLTEGRRLLWTPKANKKNIGHAKLHATNNC